MGTIGAAGPPPRRTRNAAAGWIVAGILAVALVALVAFEMGKRAHPSQAIPAAAGARHEASEAERLPLAITAITAPVEEKPSPKLESAVYDVAVRTEPTKPALMAPAPEFPAPAPAEESLDAKMSRCLWLRVQEDEIHSVARVANTQMRAFVANSSELNFVGSDVWFQVRAFRRPGGGVAARHVGRFEGGPIEARGRAELVFIMDCPACYGADYRFEISLLPSDSPARQEWRP